MDGFGQRRHERIEHQGLHCEPVLRAPRWVQEAGVQTPAAEQVRLLVTVEFCQHEFDLRPLLAESTHRVGKQTEAGRTGKTDTDPPRAATMRASGGLYGLRGVREDAVGPLEECRATCGERHLPPVADEERHIELIFETADFPAEMRLCHPKPRGSPGEAQLFRDRDEELEMTVLHVRASYANEA